MNTPICDFAREYAAGVPTRLHMPGHKGVSLLGMEALDITEVEGADVLYDADGIIRQSEENAAALFGAARTLYSAEGSSLAIRAMLHLTVLHAAVTGRRPIIAAGRNAHKTFVTAAALLDMTVEWLYPQDTVSAVACPLTADDLERQLASMAEKPVAVYITSPDYLGNTVDVAALADVCHQQGILLLVDNAHGAYLRFLPQDRHPLTLGADACCDSAHKTLPVLTGGGYLHISHQAPALFCQQAELALSLFASTSPSYLILQSLDAANRYLAQGYRERLAAFTARLAALKARLTEAGYPLVGDEPLKVTVAPKPYGYTGQQLAQLLRGEGIVCEFADPDHLVLMFTPENGEETLCRLEAVLTAIPACTPLAERMPPLPVPLRRMSPRAALCAVSRELPVADCVGRVLATPTVSCPPAVPILVGGEEIDEAALRVFAYYGISTCRVIEE